MPRKLVLCVMVCLLSAHAPADQKKVLRTDPVAQLELIKRDVAPLVKALLAPDVDAHWEIRLRSRYEEAHVAFQRWIWKAKDGISDRRKTDDLDNSPEARQTVQALIALREDATMLRDRFARLARYLPASKTRYLQEIDRLIPLCKKNEEIISKAGKTIAGWTKEGRLEDERLRQRVLDDMTHAANWPPFGSLRSPNSPWPLHN